jgi:hypothetical protein
MKGILTTAIIISIVAISACDGSFVDVIPVTIKNNTEQTVILKECGGDLIDLLRRLKDCDAVHEVDTLPPGDDMGTNVDTGVTTWWLVEDPGHNRLGCVALNAKNRSEFHKVFLVSGAGPCPN